MKGCDLSSKVSKWVPGEKKQRAQMLARALRKLGYEVTITPINQLAAKPAT